MIYAILSQSCRSIWSLTEYQSMKQKIYIDTGWRWQISKQILEKDIKAKGVHFALFNWTHNLMACSVQMWKILLTLRGTTGKYLEKISPQTFQKHFKTSPRWGRIWSACLSLKRSLCIWLADSVRMLQNSTSVFLYCFWWGLNIYIIYNASYKINHHN